MCKIIFHSHYSPYFFFLSHQTEFAAASLILHAEIQHNHVNGLKHLSAELASRGDSPALGWHCRTALPRRTVLATAGAIGVSRTPVVDHRRDVTELAPTIFTLVWAIFASIIRDMLSPTWAIRVLGTPTVQQRPRITRRRSTVFAVFTHGHTSLFVGLR